MGNPNLNTIGPQNLKPLEPSWMARATILRAVRSPLGFFVLALLIVEVFLLGAGIWFHLPDIWKITAIGVGVVLFLLVFFTVVYLVIRYPQNLVFSEQSHVEIAALIYGNETHNITIKDLEGIRPESQPKAIPADAQQSQIAKSSQKI